MSLIVQFIMTFPTLLSFWLFVAGGWEVRFRHAYIVPALTNLALLLEQYWLGLTSSWLWKDYILNIEYWVSLRR